jgi:hypothetical protein
MLVKFFLPEAQGFTQATLFPSMSNAGARKHDFRKNLP